MNDHLVRIEIRDNDSLLEACDILHDARFDLSTLHVGEEVGVWNGRFEREFFEDPSLMNYQPKLFIFVKATFPLADSELTFNGITSYSIEDKSRIGIYHFNECKITGEFVTLLFCEDMKMILTFKDKPQGRLVDHKLMDKTGSIYLFRNPFGKNRRDTTTKSKSYKSWE
ncbi:MAG: hypothetical protein ACYS32_13170 [Planctomycetota bacterium]|jgi:hypothetical protein